MQSIRPERASNRERHPCVWMQAGVVSRKYCDNDFRCEACRFDRAMTRAAEENNRLKAEGHAPKGKRGQITSWREKLRVLPPAKRPCSHHMKGRIAFRPCTNDYRCVDCEFDQYFYDQYTVHASVRPVDVLQVKGFRMPQGYYFHKGHTWVKIEEDSMVRVGIDDFAARLFGPLDRIEAPLMGKAVHQDQPEISITRDRHHASMLSPVSGVVTAINPTLREQGWTAEEDVFSGGWFMLVHPSDLRRDLKQLMIHTESKAFLESEVDILEGVVEEVAGPLAADGGTFGQDIYGNLGGVDWERITRLFLRTS